jgi:hypothetical protein
VRAKYLAREVEPGLRLLPSPGREEAFEIYDALRSALA